MKHDNPTWLLCGVPHDGPTLIVVYTELRITASERAYFGGLSTVLGAQTTGSWHRGQRALSLDDYGELP